jgi:hypothetical protein
MSRFSLHNPYFIIVVCLIVIVVGLTSVARMPVDLFPTSTSRRSSWRRSTAGCRPTDRDGHHRTLQRFFTLGSGITHGIPFARRVSIIKVFFQPGTPTPTSARSRTWPWPPPTSPPARCPSCKFDASSLPVALITLRAG